MPNPDSPRRRRRLSRRRLWLLSLTAVVLAVAGTSVALQSASARPGPHRPHAAHHPHRPPVTASPPSTATPAATSTATSPATPSATAPVPASATPTAGESATTEPATNVPGTACDRKAASAAQVKVTDVTLPNSVKKPASEGDTEVLPTAIAAAPDGTSWLAWVGTDEKVYLGRLGCDDQLLGTPTSFAGIDLQDVQADSTGGVLLITHKGECSTGPLCGGTSSPCNTMHMIRFGLDGKQVWDQQVTNLTDSLKGYDAGARFVWWYQHHGRLASDGENYAAYFGTAITVQNGNCVDIHEGDRMQVVSAAGKLLPDKGFEVGCSHAWTSRIVYDPAKKDFVTVCATDNQCRIAQPNPYRTVAAGTCDGTLFGGDLVLAKTGYWTAWSQGGTARLSRFTTGPAESTVQPGVQTEHPHLVKYGADRMLIAWGSGSSTQAKVLDRGTGATIGSSLTIAADEHDYVALKEYADGSVAFPAKGSAANTVKIARVLPMS